ncbi:MAG: hypothetical protein K2N78_01345 [Oscillospiraceae bacterium]|nr:hypothetical protein [Oscillospiraceae bacterium]
MRAKVLTAAMLALLVAAAFFLPERLLTWGDQALLDSLHMESQDEAREGLAESIQLTVAEKIMLLRGGRLTVMELEQVMPERLILTEGEAVAGEAAVYSAGELRTAPPEEELTPAEAARYAEAASLWEARLAAVRGEIRALQTMGGLPELWNTEGPLFYTDYGDLLYLDTDTHMSFQVYQISLLWEGYTLTLQVDVQSGRILSFALVWYSGGLPNWGSRNASGFGSAWRDYWQMDSVSTGWYNEYTRGILENMEAQVSNSGDYAARDQITFLYDSQSLSIPLESQGSRNRHFLITWNR